MDREAIAVEARSLTRIFGRGDQAVHALNEVDLSVRAGEFVAVLGPSGSGKTTLLHLLGALDKPTSGSVIVDGTDLNSLSEKALTEFRRNRAGFVFQSFNLLPTLTVYENIAIPYILDGRDGKEERERIDDLIELLGLRGREQRLAPALSAGEQQRVAVARALLTRPTILIADEPTGVLDSATGEEILQLLWESCDNLRQTILLVTHHPKIAGFADRVLFLQDGRIIDELRLGRREDHRNAQPVVHRLTELGL